MESTPSEILFVSSDQPLINKYTTYRYRFLIITVFALIALVNAVMSSCMSSIVTNLTSIYSLSMFIVNLGTSLIWFMIYLPTSFFTNYLLDEKGLRFCVLFGATTTIIGLWIRTLSNHSFYYIFAGQILGAIGQPSLLNVPQKLSAVWFAPHERPLSSAIASLIYPIGAGIGLVIAHIFVENDATGYDGLMQVNSLMWFIAKLGSILIVPSYFLFKDKPLTPPSRTAEMEKFSYKQSLKSLAKNSNYVITVTSTGLIWGAMNALSTIIQPIFEPFGLTGSESGILGALTLFFGLIGSAFWGIYVGKTKKYKRSYVICSSMVVFSLIGATGLAFLGKMVFMVIITGIYGFFATPLLSLSFEFCGEISFPVAEGASGGFLMFMIQIFSIVGATGIDMLLNHNTKEHALYSILIIWVMTFLGFVGYMFVKEDLRRVKLEEERSKT